MKEVSGMGIMPVSLESLTDDPIDPSIDLVYESTSVGAKTGRPRGRGSRAMDHGSMVTETRETMFAQVQALLMEVKPYVLLLFILMEMYRVRS